VGKLVGVRCPTTPAPNTDSNALGFHVGRLGQGTMYSDHEGGVAPPCREATLFLMVVYSSPSTSLKRPKCLSNTPLSFLFICRF